ncbi:MAG: glycosyltransferase family 4 protein [Alphaproteobacteria bacterium]|nr:glycosyltransferase family 4 protein [Alphaproteobacteria bacterium]
MTDRPIRVLCLDSEGGYGGSSRSLYQLIRHMDHSATEIEVWCRASGPIQRCYDEIGVNNRVTPGLTKATTVFSLSRNIYIFGRAFWDVWRERQLRHDLVRAVNERFDLIHFNHPNLFLLARWLRRCTAVPFTMHVRVMLQDFYEGTRGNRLSASVNEETSALLARWQAETMSRCVDHFVFISENERDSFLDQGGQGPGSIIYNAAMSSSNEIAAHPAIAEDQRFKIAVVENFRWSRGTDRLAEIAKALRRHERRDFLFVIAGDVRLSTFLTGELGRTARAGGTLADHFRKQGLDDYFLFLDHVSDPERVIAGCDVLISICRRAGPWGRSVIEAMSAARPVVGVGKWCGFVRPEETGILHAEFDAEKLAEDLIRLADDRETLASMGHAACAHILRLCDGPSRAADLLDVWQSVARTTP